MSMCMRATSSHFMYACTEALSRQLMPSAIFQSLIISSSIVILRASHSNPLISKIHRASTLTSYFMNNPVFTNNARPAQGDLLWEEGTTVTLLLSRRLRSPFLIHPLHDIASGDRDFRDEISVVWEFPGESTTARIRAQDPLRRLV